jgi:hypothetical protein
MQLNILVVRLSTAAVTARDATACPATMQTGGMDNPYTE